MFAHRLWSKYRAILDGTPNTNNISEGNNNAFSISLPSRPSEWVLMDRFKTEESTSRAEVHKAAVGNRGESVHSRDAIRKERAAKLKKLVGNFANLTPTAYLESLECFFES